MYFKKSLKFFLFPAANIILAVFLIRVFFIAGQSIVQTYPIARMAALNYLKPRPMDYVWEFNIHHSPLDAKQIRYYADYYENLLQVFPSLGETYGILAYCYHYLGYDAKAIDYFKKAIEHNPDITWNYYNLAVVYINTSRYEEASVMLQKLLLIDPNKSLKETFGSQWVYLPLVETEEQEVLRTSVGHIEESYKTSLALLELFKQTAGHRDAQAALGKIKLDLYAF